MDKRSVPYQFILNFTVANSIKSFILPANADGFYLRARKNNTEIRYLIEGREQGDITDDDAGSETPRDPATELASDTGVYTTLTKLNNNFDAEGGLENIRFDNNVTVYVRSSIVDVIEVMIRQ